MGERGVRNAEVRGSIPLISTIKRQTSYLHDAPHDPALEEKFED